MWLSATLGLNTQTFLWLLLASDCLFGFFHYGMLLKADCVKTTLIQDVVSFGLQLIITLAGIMFFLPYARSVNATLFYASIVVAILHILSLFFTIRLIKEGIDNLYVLKKSTR
jgi:hypothetical protein